MERPVGFAPDGSQVRQVTLRGGGLTAQEVIDTYGQDKGSYTVLNFGGGDVLTIRGISNPDNLVDDISII